MENYLQVQEIDIAQDNENNNVVILKTENQKMLIISIGDSEAHSIALALNNHIYERPLTHDLIKTILQGYKSRVEKISIYKLENNIYFSIMRIVSESGDKIMHIDCRPSDAIAIALRFQSQILVNEELLRDYEI